MPVVLAVLEPLLGVGMASALNAEGVSVVARPCDRAALGAACEAARPGVVVADESFVGDGLVEILEVLAAGRVPLLLHVETLGAHHAAALHLGVSGFVTRGVDERDLLGAVRDAATGRLAIDAAASRALFSPRSEATVLTPKEADVLRLVAADLSTRAIADALYLSESTVKTHLANARAKMGCRKSAAAAIRALELGLIRSPSARG